MLWMKGWLETRWRLLFALALPLSAMALSYANGVHSREDSQKLLGAVSFFWIFSAVFLAGAGIKTQSAFRALKGLHGSMYFTLSLPVSRFRLLAVRAGLGLLESAGVTFVVTCAAWAFFPLIRASPAPADLLQFVAASITCTTGFYFISVLLATVLDDTWQIWGSMLCIAVIKWLTWRFAPTEFDVFRAMDEASPLITHALPWHAMLLSIGAAVVLCFAALSIIRRREY